MITRRGFVSALAAAVAGAALDPERLLWVPGAKTIVLPPAGGWRTSWGSGGGDAFHVGDVITIKGRYALNPKTLRPTTRLQEFVVIDTGEPITLVAQHYTEITWR